MAKEEAKEQEMVITKFKSKVRTVAKAEEKGNATVEATGIATYKAAEYICSSDGENNGYSNGKSSGRP
eukprot:2149480-Pleurochrysis_carterae.AAC.2